MLFLLRNIRRKMLGNNKVTTYFLYAIGEIFLVVIGILIAVSIDDWNAANKQREEEVKYFRNLKNDLLADRSKLNYMIELSAVKVQSAKSVKDYINKNEAFTLYEFSDHMLNLIFVDEFRSNQSTYEEMKSSGNFSRIQNDSIKYKLLNLQQAYLDIGSSQEHMRYDYNMFIEDFEQFVNWGNYFDLSRSNIPTIELVYDSVYIENHQEMMNQEINKLFKSKVFSNNIFLLEINHSYQIPLLQKTRTKIDEIVSQIDQELDI